MWTLIVVTTFWVNGAARNVSTYDFHTVPTEARCLQLKNWIDARERSQRNGGDFTSPDTNTTAQCVKEE